MPIYKIQNIYIKSPIKLNYPAISAIPEDINYSQQFEFLKYSDRIQFAAYYNDGATPSNDLYLYHRDILYCIFEKLKLEIPFIDNDDETVACEYYKNQYTDMFDKCDYEWICNGYDYDDIIINEDLLNNDIIERLNLAIRNVDYSWNMNDTNYIKSRFRCSELSEFLSYEDLYINKEYPTLNFDDYSQYIYSKSGCLEDIVNNVNFDEMYCILRDCITIDNIEFKPINIMRKIINKLDKYESVIVIADMLKIDVNSFKFDVEEFKNKLRKIEENRKPEDEFINVYNYDLSFKKIYYPDYDVSNYTDDEIIYDPTESTNNEAKIFKFTYNEKYYHPTNELIINKCEYLKDKSDEELAIFIYNLIYYIKLQIYNDNVKNIFTKLKQSGCDEIINIVEYVCQKKIKFLDEIKYYNFDEFKLKIEQYYENQLQKINELKAKNLELINELMDKNLELINELKAKNLELINELMDKNLEFANKLTTNKDKSNKSHKSNKSITPDELDEF